MKTNFRTYELAVELYQECKPIIASARIKDQLERANLSVVLNLAEGAGKPTMPDKRKFYAIAYGSVREVQAILRLLNNSELFEKANVVGAHAYKLLQSSR